MTNLSPRLNRVAQRLKKCYTIMDVGCDHGKLGKYILENNLCKRLISSDISAESLKKAQGLIGGDSRAEFIQGDGICVPPETVPDTVIIAGMGGLEIVRILSMSQIVPEELLLVPHRNTREVREYLNNAGYAVIYDCVTVDRAKYYDVIHAVRGNQALSDKELEFGITNLTELNDSFILMLNEEHSLYSAIGIEKLSENKLKRFKMISEVLNGYRKRNSKNN